MSEPSPEPLPHVSVVIPAFNASATIGAQLAALADQSFGKMWEILVVDNGSSDGTAPLLEQWGQRLPRLRVVAEPLRGVNWARNAGVRAARGSRILLCDADDVVGDNWVAAMDQALGHYDVVAGRLEYIRLNSAESLARSAARPLSKGLSVAWRRPWGMTSNFGFHRRVFDEIGGFDTSFHVGGADDVDFCFRAGEAGMTLGYCADAVVHYRLRETARAQAKQLYYYSRGGEQLYQKHRSLGLLDDFPPNTRWHTSVTRAGTLIRDLGTLGSKLGRERYLARAGKFAGGLAGQWRFQVWARGGPVRSFGDRAITWCTPHGVVARRKTRARVQAEAARVDR